MSSTNNMGNSRIPGQRFPTYFGCSLPNNSLLSNIINTSKVTGMWNLGEFHIRQNINGVSKSLGGCHSCTRLPILGIQFYHALLDKPGKYLNCLFTSRGGTRSIYFLRFYFTTSLCVIKQVHNHIWQVSVFQYKFELSR